MTIAYLLGSLIIAALLYYNRSSVGNKVLIALFLVLQWTFTIVEFSAKGIIDFEYFKPDALSLLLLGTLSIISIPALTHSYDYVYQEKDTPQTRSIYYMSMVVLIMALSMAYLATHIAVTWIFVEITTLAASALIFHRRNAGSIEATWKYIFMSSVSLVFVFVGILFLSMSLGEATEKDLFYDVLNSLAPGLSTFWLRLAFIFIFTGFTLKMGLVPMYTAGIDAKDKAPTPAAALFSSAVMNVGFIGVFRFYEIITKTQLHQWANYVIIIAAFLSIFIATVYMVKVKNIKRMLAYSSIEHMGIIVLGLAAGGIGYYAAILHIVLHSFAKSSLFLQIGHLYRTYKTKNIYYIGYYFKYNYAGALFLLFAFLCVTAMPPSGLFVSEFYIFKALFQANYLVVLIPVLILLTFIIWSFGKNIFKILFTPPIDFDETQVKKGSIYETVNQYFLLALVIYLGLNPPQEFVNLIQEAVKNLQ